MVGESIDGDAATDGDDSRRGDTSRVGKAVEYLVAASCILVSGLELNVSTAFVDDEGVDLVFHRRGKSATLAVQVKSRSTAADVVKRHKFLADVRRATFRPRADLWMLFLVIDMNVALISDVWFVPSKKFDDLANKAKSGEIRRINASLKPDTGDKWQPYRMNFKDLPGRIRSMRSKVQRDGARPFFAMRMQRVRAGEARVGGGPVSLRKAVEP